MNRLWGRISEVVVDNESTFAGKLFVSVDVDWAHDEIMRDTHELLTLANVPSTWFATHDSPFLSELRADPNVEVGIHPNFNKLLEGNPENGVDVRDVLSRLLEIVPEARAVRSHSLLQSSRILDTYVELGLTHDASHLLDPSASAPLRPWIHWNGLVRVPQEWGDYLACARMPGRPDLDADGALHESTGLRQLNFHPIHIFLNSERLERYEKSRAMHHNPLALVAMRHDGHGVRSLFERLLGIGPMDASRGITR